MSVSISGDGSVTGIDQGLNVVGVLTASGGFSGNLTGNVTGNVNSSGVSTFTSGPVLIGSGTSTGTASQPLQVTGGAYVSGNLGIGTTTTNSRQLSIAGGGVLGTQVEIRGIVDAAGISLFSTKNYEIQSTKSNEASYPSSFVVYDRDNNSFRLVVDGSGRVMHPAQPSFLAYGNTDQNISSSNTYTKTTMWTTSFNVGSHWSSNRFTAPVAGKYLFGLNIRVDNVNSDYSRVLISKNGSTNLNTNAHGITRYEAYAGYHTNALTVLFDLAASDYVEVYAYCVTDSSFQVQSESQWWGYLVG